MKTKRSLWAIAAALAVLACGCGSNPGVPGNNDTVAAATEPPPAAAPASRAVPRPAVPADILSVLSVEHQVDLAAQRDGVVLSIEKDEGAPVRAGDVLAQMDDRDLQMELVKARDDLRVSQNNVQYKQAELKAKDAAYRRQQELRNFGLSSEADLERAEFEAKGAEYDLHGWEALVESGQAEVRRIQIEIEQMRVHAPFSGVVVSRYVRQGEDLKKDDKCFRVSQLAPLQVRFQIPESSLQKPERGESVSLALLSDSERPLKAKIVKISPTVDPASDSYDVVAQLYGDRLSGLLPGMAVHVRWPRSAASPTQP
jgi:RND family efflux transporter MFP subunit